MESLDPVKNSEGSGKRISSILKAPRKSTGFSDTEQQEHVVECPKPVEKRNSRRVSFAPANDVLLFSKDAKNTNPAQNPLQQLKTAATTAQNRVQMMVAEDGSQIMGMENLLSAPLHASQQRDMLFDIADDFGEKTVMFSTDVFMDMTHSHTINIGNDAELLGDLPLHNYDIIPTPGEGKKMFTMGNMSKDLTLSGSASTGRNADLSGDTRNIFTPSPGFDDFLSTLFKPSVPSTVTAITKLTPSAGTAQIKTQNADVDKENQAPMSVSAVMEKSLNNTRKVGGPAHGSTPCPEDDVCLDMTEAQTGRILRISDDDDPFQCLFPTQEMYARLDKRSSQTTEMKTKQQPGSKTPGSTDLKDKKFLINPALPGFHQRQKDVPDEGREKTMMFTAGEDFMDITKSHISTDSFVPEQKSDNSQLGKENQMLTTSRVIPDSSNMTEAHRRRSKGLSESDDPFQFLFPSQDLYPQSNSTKSSNTTGRQSKEVLGSSKPKEMEISKVQKHEDKPDMEKTVYWSADDACMDITRNHTVNFATNLRLQSQPNLDFLPSCGEITVRFNANNAAMDMTQCFTANIASVLASDCVLPKPSEARSNPAITGVTPLSAQSPYGGAVEMDVSMDMTEGQTGSINMPATSDPPQCLVPSQDLDATSHQLSSETNCGGLETSLKTTMQRQQGKPDTEDDHMEKTVRFSANDACMDVTRSYTVNIADNLKLQTLQNLDFLPSCGEKTVQFNANDADMDMTQCLTNIACVFASDCVLPKPSEARDTVCSEEHVSKSMFPQSGVLKKADVISHQLSSEAASPSDYTGMEASLKTSLSAKSHQFSFRPDADNDCGERTVRFSADDACIDVTQSRTVQIICHSQQPHDNVDVLPASIKKTARVTAEDTAKNVTQSLAVNTTAAFQPQSQQSADFLPAGGEKTVRFSSDDAVMDMTQSHVAISSVPDSDLPHQKASSSQENLDFPKKRDCDIYTLRRSRSLSACGILTNLLSRTSGTLDNPKTEASDTALSQDTADQMNPEKEAPGLVSAAMETSVYNTMPEGEDINASMEMTEAQTGCIFGQIPTDEPPPCDSSPHDPHFKETEQTSAQSSEETSSHSKPDDVGITSSPNSSERETRNEPNSPSAVDQDAGRIHSRKSRRMTLADLQAKIRRLSQMINTDPGMESCTAPLPHMDYDLKSQDKIVSAPEAEPEPEISEDAQAGPPSATTPFNMKTNQLMSRLSMGGFKPKLPQRSKPEDSKKVTSADLTKTMPLNFTSQLNDFGMDKGGICDEELDSYEDVSETLDCNIPQRISHKESPSSEFEMVEALADYVFEDNFMSTVHGQKRPDENVVDNVKTMNTTTEIVECVLQSDVRGHDGSITVARTASQTIDSSSSIHTASIRSEATFESSFKPSLLESHLEDYASDVQKKLEEGTITVLEFFKLFNIDFVIHNPRQSVLPGRVLSDTDVTPMDLLKNKHISRPKQAVYEADLQTLTEKVKGLKARMQDLDKPLKSVNKPLWEDMRHYSEKELKSFGSKLKERNNLFRKMGKVQSHEMKEVLYSNLVQVNLEEQQKLRGKINEADEMINSLDECIHELETEITAVEEKGFEDKRSLRSLQEEMKKATESKAECDRQTAELEMQMKQNSNELKKLKAETKNLEDHLNLLNMLNEWKLKERKDDCMLFTFLNETMYLRLVYEKSTGNGSNSVVEQKIANITFTFELDEEKSWCHARLVHKLLSQYIEGEPAWVEKYPTSRYVRQLLHDVSLVVSRCRLLGEEIRLMKMWGGLRLDILDISCVETQLRIVFSSLEKFAKFEVVFGVSLINRLYVIQLESFKNMIGNTTIQQIEEIVVSFTPGKKLLTKIVRQIHDVLLS